ncbi:unnamed protein product [Meloidogyne enterolobii]|uniref:Uncharacterized protein n=1 Tax=Meloidogyne enterolobii TaxID=390850 RepID=A0ACB0ZFY4_MELEN
MLTNYSEIKQVEDNLRWATMLSFNVKRIQDRFGHTKIEGAPYNINKFLVNESEIGEFYKKVFRRSFELGKIYREGQPWCGLRRIIFGGYFITAFLAFILKDHLDFSLILIKSTIKAFHNMLEEVLD